LNQSLDSALARDETQLPALPATDPMRTHPTAIALMLALRLLYDARSAGGRISSAADDIERARRYADLYKSAGGPNQALVDRWVQFISGK